MSSGKKDQLYVEAWNFPSLGEKYAVLFGPFNVNYRDQVLSDLNRNLPAQCKYVSYVAE